MKEKLEKLKENLKALGSVAVAFSSGVDSTFLLSVAREVLGNNCIAVTVQSGTFPGREFAEAKEFCKSTGIRHFVCHVNEMEIPGFGNNPRNRCYICKKEIFTKIRELADIQKILYVVEGSNLDDLSDYRPGLVAISELGIKSPLREAGLTKNEIRKLSKERKLPTWNKPSFACLASRFVYGEQITAEKLSMVEQAENFLMELELVQERVRIHSSENPEVSNAIARIEVLPEDFDLVLKNRLAICQKFREIGFDYVSLDLAGYRTGSMNETLEK